MIARSERPIVCPETGADGVLIAEFRILPYASLSEADMVRAFGPNWRQARRDPTVSVVLEETQRRRVGDGESTERRLIDYGRDVPQIYHALDHLRDLEVLSPGLAAHRGAEREDQERIDAAKRKEEEQRRERVERREAEERGRRAFVRLADSKRPGWRALAEEWNNWITEHCDDPAYKTGLLADRGRRKRYEDAILSATVPEKAQTIRRFLTAEVARLRGTGEKP